jgi:taurine--2-oxoglutarate transaminase
MSEQGKKVFDLDREYVFHSWSAQGALNPIVVEGGSGSYFWDFDGKKYLDFSSQLIYTNVGHQHPRIIEAIKKQADKLATVAPQHANESRGLAAKAIVSHAGDRHKQVFFTNGGADANENAIRMARIHTGRRKVLSFYRSYHGNTAVAIASTGDPRRWPNEYAADHVHFFGPYLYRSAFWSKSEAEECERALAHLENTIIFEGPQTIACILLESIVGTAGVLVPPAGYLEGVRALCDKYGIMWIADEVMSGFARSGKWFAYQNWGAEPDLITFAKGVNSGYVPLGGVIISGDIASTFKDKVFPGGLTYSGHPLACASAVETIALMEDEGTVVYSAKNGKEVIEPALRALAEKHKVIGEVRGIGSFWALDLVTNRETREPLAPYGGTSPAMNTLVATCKELGLMPMTNFNRLHVVPPCNISKDDFLAGVDILDKAFSAIGDAYKG